MHIKISDCSSTTSLHECHQSASSTTGKDAVRPMLPPKEHTRMYNTETQAVNIENEQMLEQNTAKERAEDAQRRAACAGTNTRRQQEYQSALTDCCRYREELFRRSASPLDLLSTSFWQQERSRQRASQPYVTRPIQVSLLVGPSSSAN